jgi:hypothetical protein
MRPPPPPPTGAVPPSPEQPAAEAPDREAPPGRDGQGRFAKGNAGGPGNPFARRVAALRQALLDAVTEDDMSAVAARLVEMARGGDLAAIRLLLAYTVGKPAPCVDPDTLDQHEWQVCRKSAVPTHEVKEALGVPLSFATPVVQTALPPMGRQLLRELAQGLQAAQEELAEDEADDEEALDDEPPAPTPAPCPPAPAPAGPEVDAPAPTALEAVLEAIGLPDLPFALAAAGEGPGSILPLTGSQAPRQTTRCANPPGEEGRPGHRQQTAPDGRPVGPTGAPDRSRAGAAGPTHERR